jgi:phospholipid/cholesterol/gamma-HCH transport system ATP-binding protein
VPLKTVDRKMAPIISFRQMGFVFEQAEYFHALDLDIERGETFAFYSIGNSGKSFLLRLILGLVRPTSGSVYLKGQDLAGYFPEKIYDVRQQMRFVSRDSDLLNNLTVFQNIALSLDFHSKLAEDEIAGRVKKIMVSLGLENHHRDYPVNLHEDVKKKIALARALISQPEVLLVDEFTYGYDEITAKRSLALFHQAVTARYPKKTLTTIIATTQIRQYLPYVDRIGVLFNKELIFVGTSQELVQSNHPVVRDLLNNDVSLIEKIKE